MPLTLETTTYTSPIGPLSLIEGPEGPLAVEFPSRTGRLHWRIAIRGAVPEIRVAEGGCDATAARLDEYFSGDTRRFPFPGYLLRWFDLSPAQVAVYRALCHIPFGETRAYDDIARLTGQHPRIVGQMVGANPLAILVPCHRVVGKRGSLTGYGGGLNRKRWLLAHEVRHGRVVLRRES